MFTFVVILSKTPMKKKTINQMTVAILKEVGKLGYTIREIWYCNAGWGMCYVNPKVVGDDKYVTHTYYSTIEACIRGEYKRTVLKKKEKGGYYFYIKPSSILDRYTTTNRPRIFLAKKEVKLRKQF